MKIKFLTKWEREIMDLNFKSQVKRGILTWDQVNKRKKDMQEHLEKIKSNLCKKENLTDEDKDRIFKEEFSKLIEQSR